MILYQIAAVYRSAAERLSGSDLDEQTIADTLESMAGDVEEKAIALAAVIENVERDSEAIRAAASRIKDRAEAADRKAKQLRDYMLQCMRLAGISAIERPELVVKIKKNPPSLKITGDVPDEYITETVVKKTDSAAIRDALKSGAELGFAHLEQAERIEIK